jgi:hypothetical protein
LTKVVTYLCPEQGTGSHAGAVFPGFTFIEDFLEEIKIVFHTF